MSAVTVNTRAIVHSITVLSHGVDVYEVFRAACAVTYPTWTQCGSRPADWHAPADAAGGLVLWSEYTGDVIRAEPPTDDDARVAEYVYHDLLNAGCIVGSVLASYASSGGRMVALCATSSGRRIITVARSFDPTSDAELGSTERAILEADPGAECRMVRPYSEVAS